MAGEKAVVLQSSDSFTNKLPMSISSLWTCLKLYIFASVFLHLNRHNEILAFICSLLIWASIIFFVIFVISRIRNRSNVDEAVGEIRSMKFKLTGVATADNVYAKLEPALKKACGDAVTLKREGDKIFVTYEEVDYEIILNGDGTFYVIGKNSSPDKEFYDKICKGTPIIAFGLQQAFGVK